MSKEESKKDKLPKYSQSLPGKESEMNPKPVIIRDSYKGSEKLNNKVALNRWRIPATYDPDHVEGFGKSTTMGRPGQPSEVAPVYVFLASEDPSYISGQVIHVNGGEAVGS